MKYRIEDKLKCWNRPLDGAQLNAAATDCELELWAERERMISALRKMLDSAVPNSKEHPAMFEAWENARAVLTEAENPSTTPNPADPAKSGHTTP